jgi:acetylornithine deacetylase
MTITDPIELLKQLVAINSANSSMAAGPGEAEYARVVADFGERLGARASFDEVLPGRPNVLLTLPATERSGGDTPRLLFDIHLDTVPLEPMQDALTPQISAGRLRARGACDTKGSMAAALVALQQLAASGAPRRAEILLMGTVDEEYLKRGAAHAVNTGACKGITAAVVGEPTSLQPVIAHKGAVRWKTIAHGRAAHTSRPENGINAVYAMVEVIEALREKLEPKLALETHPLLTPPTLTVGTIQGGVGVNIVPDSCTIAIDRRTLPREDPDAILAEVDAILREVEQRTPGLRIEREAPSVSERGLETSPDSPIVRLTVDACAEALGSRDAAQPVGVPYGTDATLLSGIAKIPTVVLGPGDIAQAHTADEWVEIEQVERCAGIYYRIMREFVSGAA